MFTLETQALEKMEHKLSVVYEEKVKVKQIELYLEDGIYRLYITVETVAGVNYGDSYTLEDLEV